MTYPWDWTDFFKQDMQPPRLIDSDKATNWRDLLLPLSFGQGLAVIVTSVPTFDHEQWHDFHQQLSACQGQQVEYWLLIAAMMRQYLDHVQSWLHGDVAQAVIRAKRLLQDCEPIEEFAVMACLYHYAQENMQAQMLFNYLLQHNDSSAGQLQNLRRFYNNLTERQKDVALLTAAGYTNQEVARELVIEPSVVAEHLTTIFGKFQNALPATFDKHGTRYRLIHWLTRLFAEYPELANRDF